MGLDVERFFRRGDNRKPELGGELNMKGEPQKKRGVWEGAINNGRVICDAFITT